MLLVFTADAHARISNPEVQAVFAARKLAVNSQGYAPFGGEFDGIVHKVEQDLLEAQAVAPELQRHIVAKLAFILKPLLLNGEAQRGVHEFKHVFQRIVGVFQHHLVGFDFGKIQNVVDDGQQVRGGSADFLQIVFLLVAGIGLQGQMGEADDAVHGRADFMAHVRQKFAFGLRGHHGILFFVLGLQQVSHIA